MPTAKTKAISRKVSRVTRVSNVARVSVSAREQTAIVPETADAVITFATTSPIPECTPTPYLPKQQACAEDCKSSWRCRLMALAIFLFPLIVWPWTLSLHEFPKQIFLTVIVVIGLLVILGQWTRTGTFDLVPRHLAIPLGLIAFIIATSSALRSGMPLPGLLGANGAESLSILGMLLLGLWILIAFHGGRENFKLPRQALISAGSLLSLVTILSLAGVNLYRFVNLMGFNPAGTTTTAGIIAAATLILGVGSLFETASKTTRGLTLLAILPPLLLLFGTGFRIPLISVAVGMGILFLGGIAVGRTSSSRSRQSAFLLIGGIAAVIIAIWPVTTFLGTPLEVAPTNRETWAIASQVLKENPLLGSGPATFSLDYLRFRSLPILQTPFWNVAFEWGSSTILTLFATVGWLGGGLLILTILTILVSGLYQVFSTTDSTAKISYPHLSVVAAAIGLFVALWLAPAPFAVRFFLGTLLGLILSISTVPLHFTSTERRPRARFLSALITAILILVLLGILLIQGRRVLGELMAFQGLTRVSSDLQAAEQSFKRASQLDPTNDLYLRLLTSSRKELLREFINRPVTEPESQETAARLERLRKLTDEMLRPARRSTELAPKNPTNWLILGGSYLDIASFTDGAVPAALQAFSRAQELSPTDPYILVNLASAKLLAAERAAAEDTNTLKTSAEKTLEQAAEIRPTYPLAQLELARLFAKQGKIKEAQAKYQTTAALLPQDATLRFEFGLFLLNQGQPSEAITELEKAVELTPNFSNARWYLAQSYETTGQLNKAEEQLAKVVELNPGNKEAETRLEELRKKLSE